MSDNSNSNIPGRITAPAEMLENAIGELLRRIPETWQAHRPDDLTEVQTQALFLLTAAGMVERRLRLRMTMANHPVVAEATITFTGEYGPIEALKPLFADLWADWQDAYRQWKQGDTAHVAPAHCERVEPSEWRLTVEGVQALTGLANGEESKVFDFVLKRGLLDGQPHKMPDGGIFRRGPVLGKGQLVTMNKTTAKPAEPATVRIGNWPEGGDAFVQAFGPSLEKAFAAMQAKIEQVSATTDAGDKGKKKGKPDFRAWTQDDLDKAIREYKAQRAASYRDLVEAVKKNRPGAKQAAIKKYGRNAIAQALGVKSHSMVSNSPAWLEIAQDLRLQLSRDKLKGTQYTRRKGKMGLAQAVEKKSKDAGADTELEDAERQETLRQINSLSRAGKNPRQRAENKQAAEQLLRDLLCNRRTDDQVRQVIQMTLHPNG
jgi:hypothetical protein